LDKWLKINDQDEFTKRIYFTIREINTIVKNSEAPSTTLSNFFQGRQGNKAPRFDKILLAAKQQHIPRAQSYQNARKGTVQPHEHLQALLEGQTEMKRHFPSMINTKQFKQDFLRGQPYDITHYVELKDPKKTFYQSTMLGRPGVDKAKYIGFERSSCGFGGVIPDPMIMT
jgi:hypothetical protein